jgi:small-conductance mechanosensitive channel
MIVRRFLAGLLAAVAIAVAAPVLAQTPPTAPAGAPAPTPTPTPPPPPAAAPAPPPSMLPAEVTDPVERLAKNIEQAEKSIQQLKELESELQSLRTEVERIIYESTATAESLRPQLAEVKSQIEKLGPPPAAGQPPESPTVQAERARLNMLAGQLDGAVKTTELAWVRAKQLIDRITVIRYQLFTRNLFERRDSPLRPTVWRDVSARLDGVVNRLQYYGGDWLGWAQLKSGMLWLLGLASAALFLILRLTALIVARRHFVRRPSPPTFFERVMKASWIAPIKAAAGIATALAIYGGLDSLDLLFAPWATLAREVVEGVIVFACASALITVALNPRYPSWRLIPLADRTAASVSIIMKAFVGVYAIDTVLTELGRVLYVPLTLQIAQAFLVSVTFFLLLLTLLATRLVPQSGNDRPVNGHTYVDRPIAIWEPLWVKVPVAVLAASILAASSLGYIALGSFISHQVVLSGMVLTGAFIAYLAIRAATRERPDGRHVLGQFFENRFRIEPHRGRQMAKLIELTGTLTVVTAALPLLMIQWGYSWSDIRDFFKALLFGFEVGQFRISLFRILVGIALFIALLFATRLMQRWLRDGMLHTSRVDIGIANSVDTAVGYAGVAIAALLAASYAGFDVTSLAIVAGALSVGIGFGLQSIVNNFVSGLILLVERPIKVGDWIVVGDQQGSVRRISVRSTEIETFDNASLIVPNSELISGRVLNWTHRNLQSRQVIKVSTDPVADPRQVLDMLVKAAKAHPLVQKTSEPLATLDYFGVDKLDFTLRFILADLNQGLKASSEVRVAILDAFREAGVITPMFMAPMPLPGAPANMPQTGMPALPAQQPPPAPMTAAQAKV